MTDEEIIETALHVYDIKRDAIRWAMRQVRMQENTHKSDPLVRELVGALRMVLDDPNALDGRPRTYECCLYALAAAKEAGL